MNFNAFPVYVEVNDKQIHQIGRIKTFLYIIAVFLSAIGILVWFLTFEYPTTITLTSPSLNEYSSVTRYGPRCECSNNEALPLGRVSQINKTSLGSYTSFANNGCSAVILIYAVCDYGKGGPLCPYTNDPYYKNTSSIVLTDLSAVSSICSMFLSVEEVSMLRAQREAISMGTLLSEDSFRVLVFNTWRNALQNLPLFFGNMQYTISLSNLRILRQLNLLNTSTTGINLANSYYNVADGLNILGIGNFSTVFHRGMDIINSTDGNRLPGSSTLWPYYSNPPFDPPPLYLLDILVEGVDNLFTNLNTNNLLAFSGYVMKDYSQLQSQIITSNYDTYFHECAPVSCVYTTNARMGIVMAVTTSMGVLGGLTTSIFTFINIFHALVDSLKTGKQKKIIGVEGN